MILTTSCIYFIVCLFAFINKNTVMSCFNTDQKQSATTETDGATELDETVF